MALFTPSQSPAVVVKEVDLTGGVPNVQSTTGAIVGNYRWGPVDERTLITNEAGLIETFATPDTTNNIDFMNAAMFLQYSNSLQVVRGNNGGTNSTANIGQTSSYNPANYTDPVVKNKSNFDTQLAALDSDEHTFVARFPGDLGNSLRVSICPKSTDDSAFDNWVYKSSFDGAPSESFYDSNRDGSATEVHVAVVDKNGKFSGTKGTVLETYPYVSLASNSKNSNGSTAFVKDIINGRSEYVYLVGFDSDFNAGNAGTDLTPGTAKSYATADAAVVNYDFDSGANSSALTQGIFQTAYDLFDDKEQVEVDFLIAPGLNDSADQKSMVNSLIGAAVTRKDCMVVASPHRDAIVGQTNEATITTNITGYANTLLQSSYLVNDGNYLKVYDKHNDQFIEIPAASSTAGIMALTDRDAAPWFSPAGVRRGQYLGVTSLSYNPGKNNRDALYKAAVNPIVNTPGQGIVLFGDKTGLTRPTAFDRINVRRLFIVLERAIARAAENVLFEFNDEFTRAEFVNVIEPVLRDIKGRRGITDFRIVADETVNTPAVVDRNEFIANIFIKPARSINYVTLNFVAVRTGVDFEEVTGTV